MPHLVFTTSIAHRHHTMHITCTLQEIDTTLLLVPLQMVFVHVPLSLADFDRKTEWMKLKPVFLQQLANSVLTIDIYLHKQHTNFIDKIVIALLMKMHDQWPEIVLYLKHFDAPFNWFFLSVCLLSFDVHLFRTCMKTCKLCIRAFLCVVK